jgi:hypothetical protein
VRRQQNPAPVAQAEVGVSTDVRKRATVTAQPSSNRATFLQSDLAA